MRPHAQHLDGSFNLIDLINQTMLNIDAPRIRARQIANQFFAGRWILKRIFREYVEQPFGLGPEIHGCNFPGVFLRLPRVNNRPTHQPGFFDDLDSGSAMPLRMDSRIPGIDTR